MAGQSGFVQSSSGCHRSPYGGGLGMVYILRLIWISLYGSASNQISDCLNMRNNLLYIEGGGKKDAHFL